MMKMEDEMKHWWNQEKAAGMPEAPALLKKAAGLRNLFRLKVIIQTAVLTGIVTLMLYTGLHIADRQATTTIGLALMTLSITAYLLTNSRLLPMLYRDKLDCDSLHYLNQLLRIKRQNEFMHRVMTDLYFLGLTAGLYLYLLQSALRLHPVPAVLLYLLPSVGLALTWSYSKRREFQKLQVPLNETIQKLQELTKQISPDEHDLS